MPHALRPGGVRIPRAFKDSRTVEAIKYRSYVLALVERLGVLPRAADPHLRAYGLLAVEVEEVGANLEAARKRRRVTVAVRLGRRLIGLTEALAREEERLSALAAERPVDRMAAVRAAVERAAGAAQRGGDGSAVVHLQPVPPGGQR